MGINQEGLNKSPYFNQTTAQRTRQRLIGYQDKIPGERGYKLAPRYSRATKLLAGSALGISLFMADSLGAQFEASQTNPYILQASSAVNGADEHSAINVTAGLGLRNSYPIADTLKGFASEGKVWATVYDNNGVDAPKNAKLLMERCEYQNVTELALWGDSMGGILSLEIAVDIQNSDQNLSVPYIVLENTPSSLDAVRPQQRDNGNLLLSSTELPLIAHSRIAHFLFELVARHDQYSADGFEPVSFAQAAGTVLDTRINDKDAPSSALMGSQFSTIVTSNVRKNILELGQYNPHGKPKPVLVIVRPTSDTSDQVVDSSLMEQEYRRYALEAGLQLIVIKMPGITHGDPTMNQQQYNDIIPVIVQQVKDTKKHPVKPAADDSWAGRDAIQ